MTRSVLPIHPHRLAAILDDRAAAGLVEPVDLIEQLRVNDALAPVSILDDLHDFAAEVRSSPASHALVALAGFLAGLLLVIVPALVGAAVL
jgi:hypothetical protein